MTQFIDAVNQILPDLLSCSRLDVPLRQRAKFEGWLKIELAAALQAQGLKVELEHSYSTGTKRHSADIAVCLDEETSAFVMLKTVNTNFRFIGIENRSRPITKNISGLIEDVNKLSCSPLGCHKYLLFTIFPTAMDEALRELQLRRHIGRLSATGIEMIYQSFVPRTESWGVAWYLVEVKEDG